MNNDKIISLLTGAVRRPLARNIIVRKMDRELHKSLVDEDTRHLNSVQEKRYDFVDAMLHGAIKNLNKGYLTKDTIEHLTDIFVSNTMLNNKKEKRDIRDKFQADYGFKSPNFITISPSQACNLHCYGCYACSDPTTSPHLSFDTVCSMISEVRDKWGASFVVISGGEPFMYRDAQSDPTKPAKTILDVFAKFPDMFFMTYTNGTLIDEKMAKKLQELGNVSPAISVEGYEQNTDDRRGKGVFAKVLKAFDNLRTVGVPFGVSVTATSRNSETLLTDAFYDYYFEEQGATYMWMFQFMPIGRGKDVFDLVVPPKDRVRLYRKWETEMRDKKHCIADFWNSGPLTYGCVAYAGNRGYVYVDWNGDIMPCVFVPYSVSNILTLQKEGKTITDALMTDFMKNGRSWQNCYGLNDMKNAKNLIMPCSMRDHYINFTKNILPTSAQGENQAAQDILSEDEYLKKMDEYDTELSALTQPIWEKEFLNTPEENAKRARLAKQSASQPSDQPSK
jgi:MoaA/NifB/PqqE/SkfB family radical SAM enzyme